MSTVHLIHGFIACGKTTFGRKLEVETGGLRLSPWTELGPERLTGSDNPADPHPTTSRWWPETAVGSRMACRMNFGLSRGPFAGPSEAS